VADHSPRPPRNMPSHGLRLPHPGPSAAAGTASGMVWVMASSLSCPRGRATTGGWLESKAAGYLSSPATRLMVVARMTAPSRYDSSAWRSAAARNAEVCSAVSDTWKVIPTVKAR
jgi:hypothetical protein